MRQVGWLALLGGVCAGCSGEKDDNTCAPAEIAAGTVQATVDGAEWTGPSATWRMAGSSLQLNTVSTGGWFLSVVAQKTTSDQTLEAALAAGTYPIEVRLKTGVEGGFALFYPEDGSTFATKTGDGDGSLVLSRRDGDDLIGCLEFTALSDDGSSVAVEDGTVYAQPFEG